MKLYILGWDITGTCCTGWCNVTNYTTQPVSRLYNCSGESCEIAGCTTSSEPDAIVEGNVPTAGCTCCETPCNTANCEQCVNCSCVPCGGSGQSCCNGQCYDPANQECCGGQVHDKGNCMACVNDQWISTCDSSDCEKTCVDGVCLDCGGDPNKKCCNGSCCDKVWIKKTIPAIHESCPSCVGNDGCAGNNCKIASSYDECSNVGVGSGEHCQCHSQVQTIGYIYHCINNFDVSKLLWCALRGGWCAAVCIETMSPSMCANCLAGASVDCCDGPCELCDFIESCDPDTEEDMIPVKADVFTGFGC